MHDTFMGETLRALLLYLEESQLAEQAKASPPATNAVVLACTSSVDSDGKFKRVQQRLLSQNYLAPRLPTRAVKKLADRLGVPPEIVLQAASIATKTFHRREADQRCLSAAQSDRLLRVARIASSAQAVFGDEIKANRWLMAESRFLGCRPLELLVTDIGAQDVQLELVRIEHGNFS